MEKKEYLLTVVVPIYNVERYLRQCIESLINQSVSDFNIVLVDDGSTDSSGNIAKEYVNRYPDRFTYVYKENAGLGAARNTGFLQVNTPYVQFLDSDDWLLPRTIENVLKTIIKENEDTDILFMIPEIFDMATCEFNKWMDADLTKNIFDLYHITNPKIIPSMYALEPNVNRSVWRSDFLRKHNFKFPEGVKWEDVFPHFYLFNKAKRCAFVKNAGFIYRTNSGSQITSLSNTARLDIVPVFRDTLDYAKEHNWSDIEINYIIQMLISFTRWSMSMSNKYVRIELTKELHKLLKHIPKNNLKSYYKYFSIGRSTRLYIYIFRSNTFYKLYSNRHCEDLMRRCLNKVKRIIKRKG